MDDMDGNYRVDGAFRGLAIQREKPFRLKITGTLGQNRVKSFRKRLAMLAKRYGLVVRQDPYPKP